MAKHKISTDKKLNPELQDEVQSLRGSIMKQATKNKLASHFKTTDHPDEPSVIITNTLNGKQTIVPLFAYGNVRQALTELGC